MSRGSSVVERMPEEHGVGSSILPRGTKQKSPRLAGGFLFCGDYFLLYHPKILRKFLNKVDGSTEGVGGGDVGSSISFS